MVDLPRNKVVFLVTSNVHKFNEARRILGQYKIAVAMLRKVDIVEIQDDSVENVARESAIDAVKKINLPIVVEDAGLFIQALEGFPGPYSSYVYRTLGNEGILKLMEKVAGRIAFFKSAVAYFAPKLNKPLWFVREAKGEITTEERGSQGFGFDPIFKPSGSSKTFAEMKAEEKNKHSHRARAFRRFAEWYTASI